MPEGTSQGTFVLISVIIFGIFVILAYFLFQDQIKGMLTTMMSSTKTIVDNNLKSASSSMSVSR